MMWRHTTLESLERQRNRGQAWKLVLLRREILAKGEYTLTVGFCHLNLREKAGFFG